MTLQSNEAEIRARFGSTHNFCKLSGLPRSTVYQVLNGRYAGNLERQAARIAEVLAGRQPVMPSLTEAGLCEVLSTVACTICTRKGRCTRRRARRCADIHGAQARAALAALQTVLQEKGESHD